MTGARGGGLDPTLPCERTDAVASGRGTTCPSYRKCLQARGGWSPPAASSSGVSWDAGNVNVATSHFPVREDISDISPCGDRDPHLAVSRGNQALPLCVVGRLRETRRREQSTKSDNCDSSDRGGVRASPNVPLSHDPMQTENCGQGKRGDQSSESEPLNKSSDAKRNKGIVNHPGRKASRVHPGRL